MSRESFARSSGPSRPRGVPTGRGEAFAEVTWNSLTKPGAYVERETGNLLRVPPEALIRGSSPMIRRESRYGTRLVQISHDPYVTTVEARALAAGRNVSPNF